MATLTSESYPSVPPIESGSSGTGRSTQSQKSVVDSRCRAGLLHSGIEVLIRDPLGRRLGFDAPASYGSGTTIYEIPDSFYGHIDLIASPDGELMDEVLGGRPLNFEIPNVIGGTYTFTILISSPGKWSVNFGIDDGKSFEPFAYEVHGTSLSERQNCMSVAIDMQHHMEDSNAWASLKGGARILGRDDVSG